MIEELHPWDLTRIVIGVDPAVTSGEDSDSTGIIVAGLGRDGDGYILDDLTCKVSPDAWAKKVVGAYKRWNADRVVAEVNQGGDLVEMVLRTQYENLPITLVRAHTGKLPRAEPIAALFEQRRVHMVGMFAELEDQCCEWVPGETRDSPDRLDAMVWALTDLMGAGAATRAFAANDDLSFFAARPKPSLWRT